MTTEQPYDEPTAGRLIAAVREFIAALIAVECSSSRRYDLRVAASALAIAEREIARAQVDGRAHRDRLDRLGFASDAELVNAIRSGLLDHRLDDVGRELREMVSDKLAVARPGYDR